MLLLPRDGERVGDDGRAYVAHGVCRAMVGGGTGEARDYGAVMADIEAAIKQEARERFVRETAREFVVQQLGSTEKLNSVFPNLAADIARGAVWLAEAIWDQTYRNRETGA